MRIIFYIAVLTNIVCYVELADYLNNNGHYKCLLRSLAFTFCIMIYYVYDKNH